jgi:polysaccharide export outer membrane protein
VCSRRLAVACALATLLSACASAPRRTSDAPTTGADLPRPYTSTDPVATAGPPQVTAPAATTFASAARIGPNDLLEITLLESPEMNRTVRVSQTGGITLPLLGEVAAAGQTPRELELALEGRLRERYVRDPHVTVQVTEMQSHGVAVVGAVARPGVFQTRESRRLLEFIALAGGFSDRAGDAVQIVRDGAAGGAANGEAASAGAAIEVRVRELLDSGDPRLNVVVNPGDLVKVSFAGVVYVVGEVRRPGAFPIERGAQLSVLQAIALGEGLGPRAAKSRAVIIRTTEAGDRHQIPVDLGDVLAGRSVAPQVQSRDVVFVPNNAAKAVALGTIDALLRMVTLRAVF